MGPLIRPHWRFEDPSLSNTGTFTVVLDSSPGATDTITVDIDPNSNGDGVDLTVNPTQLTFTTADWDTPQTVTVTAIDDTLVEGEEVDQVGFTITSAESDPCYVYARLTSVVSVTIYDNDTGDLIVSKTSASVAEGGGGDTYTVQLTIAPTDPVTINVAAENLAAISETDANLAPEAFDCQITVNGSGSASLVFNSGNYSTPQTVTVAAVDDSLYETDPHVITIGNHVDTIDPDYSAVSAVNVDVSITENDARGWSFGDDAALAVPNYSFETPALGDGGVADFNTVNPIPGHEYWAAGELKIVNPTTGEWAAMYKTATEAPDGTQILYLEGAEPYSGTEPRFGACEYLIEPGPVSYTFEASVGVPEPNNASANITFYIDAITTDDAGNLIARIDVPPENNLSLAAGDLVAGEWVDIKVCGEIPVDSSLTAQSLAFGVTGQFVHVDNFRLKVGNYPCDGCYVDITEAEGDLDDNCKIDLADFAIMAGNYLNCNIYPDCLTSW